MKIEVVEFYPEKEIRKEGKKPYLVGSLHVFLPEIGKKGVDIRGIMVHVYHIKKIIITPPHEFGWDEELQKKIKFSVISFFDEEENKTFKEEVIKEGRDYIYSYIKEKNWDGITTIFDKKPFRNPKFKDRPPRKDETYVKKPYEKKPYDPNFKKKKTYDIEYVKKKV